MHNTGEILQLCRLCLVKEQVNVPIFEGQGDVKQIFQKISSCLPVKINRSDKLPKNICDGCSEKLDLFYDFWNTSVNSEKQLLEWLGQTPLSAGAGTTIAAKNSKSTDPVQQIKVDVKQEPSDHTDNNESFQADASAVADEDETSFKSESGPPPKRARRAATKRKPITVAPDTDDDDDDDYEPVEPLTKLEDESGNSDNDNEDDSFANAPSTSADDQPGPSGIGKDGVEAPKTEETIIIKFQFPCTLCNEIFPTQQIFSEHLRRHKIYECYICLKKFLKMGQLIDHKKEAHTKIMCCPYCNTFFPNCKTKEPITRHIREEHCNIKCNQCDEILRGQKAHMSHQMKKHGDVMCICYTCGKGFPTKRALNKHEVIHMSKEEIEKNGVECKICNQKFASWPKLHNHSNKVHEKKYRQYKCDQCDKVLSHFRLKVHKMNHAGIKPFVCDICGYKFAVKGYLKNHMLTHTGEKPLQCKICLKRFTQHSGLIGHMRSQHPK